MIRNDTTLINFNISSDVKAQFDYVCHASGRTRTSVLVQMVEDYILSQSEVLAARSAELVIADRTIRYLQDRNGVEANGPDGCHPDGSMVLSGSESNFGPFIFGDDEDDFTGDDDVLERFGRFL
jgi:predicted transcriptional regulator